MKFLIIGLGSMGKRRIRCLRFLGFDDVIGFDPRHDRRNEASRDYNIATIGQWTEAAAEAVNAWIIATPPDTHSEYGLQAIDRGMPFFTEASVDEPQTPRLIERLGETGVIGAPSCTMRYYEGPRKIKQILSEGLIGKPLTFTYHSGQYLPDWHPWEDYRDFYVSKRHTGACREIVPFEFNWLINLFGDIVELRCIKAKLTDLEVDIDDLYQLLLQFDSVVGHMMVDVISRPAVRRFCLLGTAGTLIWDHQAANIRIWSMERKAWDVCSLGPSTIQPGYINGEEPYIAEMSDFVAAVRGEFTWPHSYTQDRQNLDLLLAAEHDADVARV